MLRSSILYDPSATKETKRNSESREALKAGDKVITAGGIYGKIKEIGDTYMLIEISDGVRIRVDKTSVFASVSGRNSQNKQRKHMSRTWTNQTNSSSLSGLEY